MTQKVATNGRRLWRLAPLSKLVLALVWLIQVSENFTCLNYTDEKTKARSLGTILGLSSSDGVDFEDEAGGGGFFDDITFNTRLSKRCMSFAAISGTPDQINVTFHLYTRQNPHVPAILTPQVSRRYLLEASPFRASKPVKWITHGFKTNIDKSDWMIKLKNKILAYEDANVFLTDWGRGAQPALSFYPKAAANVHVVAKLIVDILRRISNDIEFQDLHLIGHSLGAHIMGFVGTSFTGEFMRLRDSQRASPQLVDISRAKLVGRITGCDPALPCFGPSSMAPEQIDSSKTKGIGKTMDSDLNASWHESLRNFWPIPKLWTHLEQISARIVEVMHTNAGAMGYSDPIGDYDFYPNGLDIQPGCGRQKEAPAAEESVSVDKGGLDITPITSALNRLIKSPQNFIQGYTCSHRRSVDYLIESLYSERVAPNHKFEPQFACQMVAYKCTDYNRFKQGFCTRCTNSDECRIFGMQPLGTTAPVDARRVAQSLSRGPFRPNTRSNTLASAGSRGNYNQPLPLAGQRRGELSSQRPVKKSAGRNLYYFDTRTKKSFCSHHYNLVVNYRRYKIRDDATIENAILVGSADYGTHMGPVLFSKLAGYSYTGLVVEEKFLGRLETLLVWGEELRFKLVEFIEVSYLSNLDPEVRAHYSARLCRTPSIPKDLNALPLPSRTVNQSFSLHTAGIFVRCSGMVMV